MRGVAPRRNATKMENLMSVGRIAARAALAAAGVLASVALMAAPSWANGEPNPNPPGGNHNQAHNCQGSTGGVENWKLLGFTSHDECVSVLADKLK